MRNALITDMEWLSDENKKRVITFLSCFKRYVSFKILTFNETVELPYEIPKGYTLIEEIRNYKGWFILALIMKQTKQ